MGIESTCKDAATDESAEPRDDADKNIQPGMGALIACDLARWCAMWASESVDAPRLARLRARASLILHECGVRSTLLYRISSGLHRARIPFLPGMFRRMNVTLYGLDIPPSVNIGGGLYIPHPVGTAIMAASIGSNVSIISGVTIGMRNEWAFPTIGNRVFIGAGARLLGAIVVGDGASIGANAVVLSDIPAGATAVGIPAKVLQQKGAPVGGSDV